MDNRENTLVTPNDRRNLTSENNSEEALHFLLSDHPEYETGRDHYLELHKKDKNIHIKAVLGFAIFFVVLVSGGFQTLVKLFDVSYFQVIAVLIWVTLHRSTW